MEELPVEYRWVDRQTDRTAQHVRQTDGLQTEKIDCQADRRTARQTDGMSGRHMDCQTHRLLDRQTDCQADKTDCQIAMPGHIDC